MMLFRHLLSILLLPAMAAGVMPWWIRGAWRDVDTRWAEGSAGALVGRAAGAVVLAVGLALFAWCVALFARVGQGTLAPWDPTRRLVAVGPYRHVRNPMITGVATMLVGQALLAGSRLLALWAATFVVVNHLYFLLSEEPGLERRFGASYAEYKREVPRWLPRIR
jgi:protein-S-isoprenylcysteine O-methyltransferase Ste14